MTEKYSDLFGVSHNDLMNHGAFDAFLNIDSRLHVDPFLLRTVSIPELSNSYNRFTGYFNNIIRLLKQSKRPNDRLFREVERMLVFRELPNISLGYSKTGSGSGIGTGLARNLALTAREIVNSGIEDPVIFELVGLLEKGIGPDRISDMTIRIILPDLLNFSQRITNNLDIRCRSFTYDSNSYNLPLNPNNNRPIILIPNELLRDLPVANDWSDIERVIAYNEQLRRIVNRIIGRTWKQAINKLTKDDFRALLLEHPDLLRDLISQYNAKSKTAYDFNDDPNGVFAWDNIAQTYSQNYPLQLNLNRNPTPEQLLDLVITICNHFRTLVENNRLSNLLYKSSNELHHESFAQLLLFGIADSYCTANNIDITREANGGRGPVDFKFSHGRESIVTVEVKLTTNSHLISGYETQLPIYNNTERAHYSIYLVIRTDRVERKIRKLESLRREQIEQGLRAPELIIVNGLRQPSASRATSLD